MDILSTFLQVIFRIRNYAFGSLDPCCEKAQRHYLILCSVCLLQAASSRLSAVTPGVRGACKCGDLSSWVIPPTLGVTSQLCHSNASWPNLALGRGGIRNPIRNCCRWSNGIFKLVIQIEPWVLTLSKGISCYHSECKKTPCLRD